MAVLAPMPRARVSTATAVKPGTCGASAIRNERPEAGFRGRPGRLRPNILLEWLLRRRTSAAPGVGPQKGESRREDCRRSAERDALRSLPAIAYRLGAAGQSYADGRGNAPD